MIETIVTIGALIIGFLLCSFLVVLSAIKDDFRRKEWENEHRRIK